MWSEKGAKNVVSCWFYFDFKASATSKNVSFINTVWKMQGLLLESMRNDSFHTVDTSLQSEWDGEELMLLTRSWGH